MDGILALDRPGGHGRHELAPLRVAILSTQRDWGGGEAQGELLARGLVERGHGVLLLAPRQSAFATKCLPAGIARAHFQHNGLVAAWQIRRAIRRFQPHVLYWNDPRAALFGTLACLGCNAARIATKRTFFPLRSVMLYERFCDAVICSSSAIVRVCRDGGVASRKLVLIYDGVSPERIRQANRARGREELRRLLPRSSAFPGAVLLIAVGKLTHVKGHAFLVDAFRSLAAKRSDLFLTIVGDGELFAPLSRKIAEAGLSDRVALAGFRNDVADLLVASDVFVFPSLAEGLGTSAIDAMLAGLPVVASDVGGIPELLSPRCDNWPGTLGWLVPPRNSDELAKAIWAAVNLSSQDRARLGAAARETAERFFVADRMVDENLQVFRALLDAKRAER